MAAPDNEGVGEAAGEALATIVDWLETAPTLHGLDEARFLVALNAFEGASNQRPQIARRLGAWRPATPSASLRVLSIGCGGGDLDVEVARSLAVAAPVSYVGVDPNQVECDRCEALFASRAPDVAARAEAVSFERFEAEHTFDLIYAAHTLYYLDDLAGAVARARDLLRPDGTLIVIHAPLGALNRLARPFWAARLERRVLFSDALLPYIGDDVETFTIDADIDATTALEGAMSDVGRAIVDFMLQLDSARLPEGIQDAVVAYLRAIARRDEARWLVPHPTDGFVVRP